MQTTQTSFGVNLLSNDDFMIVDPYSTAADYRVELCWIDKKVGSIGTAAASVNKPIWACDNVELAIEHYVRQYLRRQPLSVEYIEHADYGDVWLVVDRPTSLTDAVDHVLA